MSDQASLVDELYDEDADESTRWVHAVRDPVTGQLRLSREVYTGACPPTDDARDHV